MNNSLNLGMLEKFSNHVSDRFPFLKGAKLLLAVSGGIDSMVMAELFRKLDFDPSIAHCNFKLRDHESDNDEAFVRDYCELHRLKFHTIRFDTASFANDFRLSVQVAARQLRYRWFGELLANDNYDYLLTAHHADDNIETFLLNLSRGTGLDGLTGIPRQNDKIIRPLLVFSRNEIEDFAAQNKIFWREDSSNSEDKYARNKIRHILSRI